RLSHLVIQLRNTSNTVKRLKRTLHRLLVRGSNSTFQVCSMPQPYLKGYLRWPQTQCSRSCRPAGWVGCSRWGVRRGLAPCGPCSSSPCLPCGPCLPCAPCSCLPCAPSGPCLPCAPCHPCAPCSCLPCGPCAPCSCLPCDNGPSRSPHMI
uniref:Uncharacterized protein n=1 Tax=Gadus morhua TaxID=8049 RepID=A0A8C5AQU3_GADMO